MNSNDYNEHFANEQIANDADEHTDDEIEKFYEFLANQRLNDYYNVVVDAAENAVPKNSDTQDGSEDNIPTKKNHRKKIKVIPDLSLSFATIGSRNVQLHDDDPTIAILEKTPDGKAYTAEPRPHRSKQWKRVHPPSVELLSM